MLRRPKMLFRLGTMASHIVVVRRPRTIQFMNRSLSTARVARTLLSAAFATASVFCIGRRVPLALFFETWVRDPDHSLMPAIFAKVSSSMGGFSILTNRKRSIVALVHSLVFLLIAVRQMVAANPAAGIWVVASVSRGTWALCGIFVVVSSILFWLFVISRGLLEKIYFGLCTVSATSGLIRTAAGDQ